MRIIVPVEDYKIVKKILDYLIKYMSLKRKGLHPGQWQLPIYLMTTGVVITRIVIIQTFRKN
ncbi:MAG: hypothetical protein HQ569_04130 [Actinobacteria bacterium]|nr:hypothetical protein [Actinomycetota bacterium]